MSHAQCNTMWTLPDIAAYISTWGHDLQKQIRMDIVASINYYYPFNHACRSLQAIKFEEQEREHSKTLESFFKKSLNDLLQACCMIECSLQCCSQRTRGLELTKGLCPGRKTLIQLAGKEEEPVKANSLYT